MRQTRVSQSYVPDDVGRRHDRVNLLKLGRSWVWSMTRGRLHSNSLYRGVINVGYLPRVQFHKNIKGLGLKTYLPPCLGCSP